MIPLVIESEPDIDLLHTLEIEIDDAGQLWLHDYAEDCVGSKMVTLCFPADKAEAIAAAFMRAAKDARA